MMSLKFIDKPQKKVAEDYSQCVNYFVEKISKEKGVLAIYQFGSFTTPGISDIDILVVFEDGAESSLAPIKRLPIQFNELLTHGIDAISKTFFQLSQQYTFWHNVRLIYGVELRGYSFKMKEEELRMLRIQTAMEYLIINYVDLIIQKTYRIIKLRAFLQHVKGLIYDLELLGINQGEMFDEVMKVRGWILNWHQSTPDFSEVEHWIHEFEKVFKEFIQLRFSENKFFAPVLRNYFYKRNIELKPAEKIYHRHEGIVLSNTFSFIGKRFYNLHHRTNNFEFGFPMVVLPDSGILSARYQFFEEMKKYNKKHFPNFDSLTVGLGLHE